MLQELDVGVTNVFKMREHVANYIFVFKMCYSEFVVVVCKLNKFKGFRIFDLDNENEFFFDF